MIAQDELARSAPRTRSLVELFETMAASRKSSMATKQKRAGRWEETTWGELARRTRAVSDGLASLGVQKGDRIAIIGETHTEWIIADLGIGFVAVSTAKNEVREGLLKSIPIAPLPMVRNLGLIYRKDKPLSRAALGFIELVADFAKNRNKQKKEAETAAPAAGGKAAKVS